MKNRCLLIKTSDNRSFLTQEENLPSLIEFAKTFSAEIYMVEPHENAKILAIKPLTSALCNPAHKEEPAYENAERIFPHSKRDRQTILSDAKIIRQFISKKLLSGQPVSLKEIKDKYKGFDLTDACLCNHMAVVRKSLTKEGHSFRKIGAGKYCLAG